MKYNDFDFLKNYSFKEVILASVAGVIIVFGFLASAVSGFLMLLLTLIFGVSYSIVKNKLGKERRANKELRSQKNCEVKKIIPENLPFPVAVIDENHLIYKYNKKFYELFGKTELFGVSIENIIKGYSLSIGISEVLNDGVNYNVYAEDFDFFNEKKEYHNGYFISLFNEKNSEINESKARGERTSVGIIIVDNYEEVNEKIDETTSLVLTALLDRKLNDFVINHNGFIRKYEKDKYIMLLSVKDLEDVKNEKFEILKEIKSIKAGEHIPVTLSMGIGINKNGLTEAMKNAKAALDLALGRGGDQAVIKEDDNIMYFGGTSSENSHNARIRARIKANALKEIIEGSDTVFTMGHRQGDMDSLGACLGMYRITKSLGKNCYIVLDDVSKGIRKLYDRLMEAGYRDVFVTGERALGMINEKSLVIVNDTHISGMVECPELLKAAKKKIVFDHHRKSAGFIDDTVLSYHEPYASSTCELVAEVIQIFRNTVKLKPEEADALLAGMTVDTKNFSQKTGTITFEMAAFLKRYGADTIRVKTILQDDFETFRYKAEAIYAAKMFMDGITISVVETKFDEPQLIAAQAADSLLNITGVKAAFVLCQKDGVIYASARSLGEINVQVIMEKLGGGGHQTIAGAQFENTNIVIGREKIENAITEYFEEV